MDKLVDLTTSLLDVATHSEPHPAGSFSFLDVSALFANKDENTYYLRQGSLLSMYLSKNLVHINILFFIHIIFGEEGND